MTRLYAALLSFIILLLNLSLPAQTHFPNPQWEEIADEEVAPMGYDYDALVDAWRYIRDSTNATGVFVVVNGRLMFPYGDVEETSYVASVRKSILAILYGKYVENGTIDLDATLEEMGIDDHQNLSALEKKATNRHLIAARSGIYHPASNAGDDTEHAPERGAKQPGSYYLYNNWDFNAAGALFEHQSGIDIFDALQTDLATTIEMQDFVREDQHKLGDLERSKFPAYHMWISTRDLARIGLLMLNKGKWQDKQIVSEEWINEITSLKTRSSEMNPENLKNGIFGYGYMWWVWDNPEDERFEGAYSARGAWGQYITVIPKLQMVVAMKTHNKYRRTTGWDAYYGLLKRLVRSKLK